MSSGYGSAVAPLPPHLDPRRPRSSSGGRWVVWRRVGLTVLAMVSVFALVVSAYAFFFFRNVDHKVPRFASNFTPRAAQTKTDFDGSDQNLLVVGNDDRSNLTNRQAAELKVGKDGGSIATDSMMIIHIPADGSNATLISLPRDSYVNIPGYGMNKLNAAYAMAYTDTKGSLDAKRTAGAELLTKTVSNLTGLTIDHFIQVTLLGFVQISDAVGGVTVNLCHAVDDTVAYNASQGVEGGSGFVSKAGVQTLQGVRALEFVRQRHNLPNGDLDRAARQRYFLTQAFRKVVSAGTLFDPSRLNALANAVENSVYVDAGFSLTDLARQVGTLSPDNIVSKAIPFQGFQDTEVGSVEVVNPAIVQRFVKNLIDPPAAKPSPSTAPSTSAAGSTPASGPTSTTAKPKPHKKPAAACIN
ncbi:MAG: LCP family protein [Jatrophihabitans sp.]|uniref:LCP family protein n=1 Tax=Jatrophihabitans sp. TaxID=1932789 RepID=UPI003F7E7C72